MRTIKITSKKTITLACDESMNRYVVDKGTILEETKHSTENYFKFKDGFTGNIYSISKLEYEDCIKRNLIRCISGPIKCYVFYTDGKDIVYERTCGCSLAAEERVKYLQKKYGKSDYFVDRIPEEYKDYYY